MYIACLEMVTNFHLQLISKQDCCHKERQGRAPHQQLFAEKEVTFVKRGAHRWVFFITSNKQYGFRRLNSLRISAIKLQFEGYF